MCSVDIDLILHPENLPRQVLLRILQERKVKIDDIESMSTGELIQIYNDFCLPQGQRKYRDTIRGKILSKQQQDKDKQIKSPHKTTTLSNGRKISDFILNTTDSGDRSKRKLSENFSNNICTEPAAKKQRNKITWP